jgi:hypothetical protein
VMHALSKSPSAKLSVRAPAMARRRARARPHRLSFLPGGDDPGNRIVEEIPAEGFGGRRHAVHFLSFNTDLLTHGVPLEDVQHLAGHAVPGTTGLYDRRQKKVTRNIVERISI